MLPIDFAEANFTFKKPENMTDEECSDLRVHRGTDLAGWPVIVSAWKLSKEDLEEVQKTGIVYLQITGNGMPPVYLTTQNPFTTPGEP